MSFEAGTVETRFNAHISRQSDPTSYNASSAGVLPRIGTSHAAVAKPLTRILHGSFTFAAGGNLSLSAIAVTTPKHPRGSLVSCNDTRRPLRLNLENAFEIASLVATLSGWQFFTHDSSRGIFELHRKVNSQIDIALRNN